MDSSVHLIYYDPSDLGSWKIDESLSRVDSSVHLIYYDPSDLGSWKIDESLSRVDSSVHLIYYDPSDLGSLILIRIVPKERTHSSAKLRKFADVCMVGDKFVPSTI